MRPWSAGGWAVKGKRLNVRAILADADLRRKLMVPVIQATQAREGIETTPEQADRAYYVVSEGEQIVFFSLAVEESRERAFVEALRSITHRRRKSVPRRDFACIEGAPLEYTLAAPLSHVFREHAPLEPYQGVSRQGLATTDDSRFIRFRWEVLGRQGWVPLAKGGLFSRFYADIDTVIDWASNGYRLKRFIVEREGSETKRIYSQEWYFREGLTYLHRSMRGFCIRHMPAGCIFSTIGKAVIPERTEDVYYLLAILASEFGEAVMQLFSAAFTFQAGMVGRFPVPARTGKNAASSEHISALAGRIEYAKRDWDVGNELSSVFQRPWLLGEVQVDNRLLKDRIDAVIDAERRAEAALRRDYVELNDEVYHLYGIRDSTRAIIEETLGERPPEVLWPQMEGKSVEQKRMEHVWRLLSYMIKRVIESDDEGIVPFGAVAGESPLVDRVRHELAVLFPIRDINQVEVEIANELKRSVKGYRRCASIAEWLDNAFFEYHCGLYKSRPIYWHIASAQGAAPFAFGVLVHYHRFDKDRVAKLRASYVRDAIESFRREAALADRAGRTDDRLDWQTKVEEAQALDQKLRWIQEGNHDGPEGGDHDYRILTPWKSPSERPQGWDPDLDDGVKVNIEPFEKAGVLRVASVK